jgi:glycosyltransferase involved in cell wall biosynthesis
MRSNKSIVISCSAPPNNGKGISTYSKLITEEYVRLGYKVYYLCPRSDASLWFEENNITPIFFDPFGDHIEQTNNIFNSLSVIKDLIAIINNDVIFIQALAPLLKVPLISVVHLDRFTISKAALINFKYTDYVVAISYDMYKSLIKSRVSPSKCALIFNGLPSNEKPTQVNFNKLNMMTGVEFSERKGGYSLLILLKKLKTSNLDFSFTWFGRVPKKVSSIFTEDARFNFVSQLPREEYLQKVKESNLYLFPSKEEGCPMSLKEAMNDGLVPIVADGIGAMKNIVQNGIDGYLLNTQNWDDEAYKLIVNISKDPKILEPMSIRATEKINRY